MNVIRDGGNATINIPWSKYGADNNPVQTLDEIRRDLARSINSVADLQERFQEEVRVQSGIVGLPYSSGQRPLAEQIGEQRRRGIVGGRVDFPVAFARVPEVHIALASVDMANEANVRLRVGVTSVDREGFECHLYS